jgi:hypothetical protein
LLLAVPGDAGRPVIRWTTAVAFVGVAAARLVPLTVDGLIYASSMVMFDCARRKVPVPALARWLLGLGITATLAANVAHGLGHGLTGAAVAAWPAVALVGSCELLMMIIRSAGCREPGRPWAGSLSACRIPVRRRCGRRRHSRSSLRPGACRRCARDPRPAACGAAAGPAGTRLPGRAQRHADGRVPRTSGCDL